MVWNSWQPRVRKRAAGCATITHKFLKIVLYHQTHTRAGTVGGMPRLNLACAVPPLPALQNVLDYAPERFERTVVREFLVLDPEGGTLLHGHGP